MAKSTNIEWADSTFNPWIGCQKVSPACDHCYAEKSSAARSTAARIGVKSLWEDGQRHRTSASNWQQPLKWNAEATAAGERRRVFCASLADVFDNVVPDQWRADLFRLIRSTPNLDWMLLTKRIGNAGRMINQALSDAHLMTSLEPLWPWPNVWLGATIVNQEEADRDIPKLLHTSAHIHFVSIEPMLGPIDLNRIVVPTDEGFHASALRQQQDGNYYEFARCLDWVIVGGESGIGARPMHEG